MINSTLLYGLATLASGILGVSIRYCFKSKCVDVTLCWGLLQIHRDTDTEMKTEEMELKNNKSETNETNI